MEDKIKTASGKEDVSAHIAKLLCKSEQAKVPTWLQRIRSIQAQEQSRQQ